METVSIDVDSLDFCVASPAATTSRDDCYALQQTLVMEAISVLQIDLLWLFPGLKIHIVAIAD